MDPARLLQFRGSDNLGAECPECPRHSLSSVHISTPPPPFLKLLHCGWRMSKLESRASGRVRVFDKAVTGRSDEAGCKTSNPRRLQVAVFSRPGRTVRSLLLETSVLRWFK